MSDTTFNVGDIVDVVDASPQYKGRARVVSRKVMTSIPTVYLDYLDGRFKKVVDLYEKRLRLVATAAYAAQLLKEGREIGYLAALEEFGPFAPPQYDYREILRNRRDQYPTTAEEALDLKPTNPKDAIGSSKLPLHLWPETATLYGCLGLLDGALKYGRGNWRDAGVRMSIYIDATRRHLAALFEGEDVDPDSGVPHLSHALACLAIIADAQAAGKLIDDRNFPGGYRELVEELTPHVGRLQVKHEHRDPKHFTIADVLVDSSGSE